MFGAKYALFHKFKSNLTKLTPPKAHIEFLVFRDPDKLFTVSSKTDLPECCKNKQTLKSSQEEKLFWLGL